MAKTIVAANSTVLYILKKQEFTYKLSNTKRPEDHGGKLKQMIAGFF